MKFLPRFVVLLAFALAVGTAAPVFADSITVKSVEFTGMVTSDLATLTVQCTNASVCGSWFLGDITLKGFSFTGAPSTGAGTPSAYSVANGGQNDSSGCNGKDTQKAVCWNTNTPLTLVLGTTLWTFTANIANGTIGDDGLHVQALGFNNSSADQTRGGKTLAVSNDLVGPGSSVPEPASMFLLATGLCSLGLFSRRKLRR